MGDTPVTRGWEYQTIPASRTAELTRLGKEGWELAGTSAEGQEAWLILKRQGLDFRERVTLEQRAAYYQARGLAIPADDSELLQ